MTQTTRTLALFALIALAPVPLIAGGAVLGGGAVWAALGYMTLLAAASDRLVRRITPALAPDQGAQLADLVSIILALGHFVLLALAVLAVSGATGLPLPQRLALFFAAGLYFGQVSNSNAHELIHRHNPWLRGLGVAVYTSLLFGHHASAHPKVHHRFVATPKDPNSAREGVGFYRFAPRAWLGSFVAGFKAERQSQRARLHPYVYYVTGALLTVAVAGQLAGPAAIASLLLLAGYAQTQLLLSDYVQHYGLTRKLLDNGRPEAVSPKHSWNAHHWFTSLLMLNAPRHSDHHAHPARPYPSLRLPAVGEAPRLPHSLPVMAVIALFPPLWRRVMRRELAKWRALG